ncbi:MAG: pantoate--beta-alanine ligase [Candidatus Kapaibacterium sp.]
MKLIESLAEIRLMCEALRREGKRIGLVPTMGYLHDGHLALIKRARRDADVVIATIFVNPTQFAAGEDLSTYPRDPDGDRRKLEDAGCDILYLPRHDEIYPDGFASYVTVDGLALKYEGAFRPTHFRGVATIVAKFFNIINPDVAVFGRKDAQQAAVIRQMIRDLSYGVRLIVEDTVREADGLAMSSRNVYLSPEEREESLSISRALGVARDAIAGGATVDEAERLMRAALSPVIVLDYADIIDPRTFEHGVEGGELLGIFAGRVGRTRLIDTMVMGAVEG